MKQDAGRKPFSRNIKTILQIRSPSPKRMNNMIHCLSQGSKSFLKKVSARRLVGSMTVEAAVILPLFFFFFAELGSVIEMIRLHGKLELALWNTGNQWTLIGTAAEDFLPEMSGLSKELANQAVLYGLVKNQLAAYLGEDYIRQSPLPNGTKDLQLWESKLVSNGDLIDLRLTYQVNPLLSIGNRISFRMANRYYAHAWTGYDVLTSWAGTDTEEERAYIADYPSVYHLDPDCSHLLLNIRCIRTDELEFARNQDGMKYQACAFCAQNEMPGELFVGAEGDHYHYRSDCQGLKRSMRVMPLSEAKDKYKGCERCAGERKRT